MENNIWKFEKNEKVSPTEQRGDLMTQREG